jgi:hypothetical protein
VESSILEGPRFVRALTAYENIRKLDDCLDVDLFSLEYEGLVKWVAKMVKESC